MVKRPVTWFVLTDGSRARILKRRSKGPDYEVVEELESPDARVPSREIMSDRPGRVQESAYTGRHAVDGRHDAHRERKDAFARELAHRLNRAATDDVFHALILYAAPRTLAVLRDTLKDVARDKIKAEIPKDLTRVPLADLPGHFAELTKPADPRARSGATPSQPSGSAASPRPTPHGARPPPAATAHAPRKSPRPR